VVVGGLAYGFWETNLKPLANVDGTQVGRAEWQDRKKLLDFRATRAQSQVRAALADGSISSDLANRRLASIDNDLPENDGQVMADLVDLVFQRQLAAERGVELSAEELDAAKEQITELVNMFPNVSLLIGNHDALVERQATTAGISAAFLKPFKEQFELPRGWTVYPRYHKLVVDGVIYQHGDQGKSGQFAALKNAQSEFCSVVQGHHHSQSGVWYHANENSLVFGMQTGCGIDRHHMQMAYGTKFSAKPIISCGVVVDSQTAFVERMTL
jgi:hypothetical protein